MMNKKKYRLITRSDLDGLICAVLLKELDIVDEIKLILHPSDMQQGKIKITENDIVTNLPYVPGVHLNIDHHFSETLRNDKYPNHIIDPDAPSAARVVYEYFGGKDRFPASFDEMMAAVDKADSGQFTREDVVNSKGWELLNFLIDEKTGIERFGDLRISNDELEMNLIDHFRTLSIDEILELPDVKERADIYFQYQKRFKTQLERCSALLKNLIVLDYRKEEVFYPGNRFLIYALYPECNITIQIKWEADKEHIRFSVGKSIFNQTSGINIGELMLGYGGGGHRAAGSCQSDAESAEAVLKELIEKITADS